MGTGSADTVFFMENFICISVTQLERLSNLDQKCHRNPTSRPSLTNRVGGTMILTLLYTWDKDRMLQAVGKNEEVMFKGMKILFLLDVGPTSVKRRELNEN